MCSLFAAESADEQFLAGLRERRLFELAELYCRDQLARSTITERQRADMTIELARTFGQWALHSTGKQREAAFTQAHAVASDFSRQHRNSPRLPLVELQDALTLLAEGELARQEAELSADRQPRLEDARDKLRLAASKLEATGETIADRLRAVARKPAEGDELTADELGALETNVGYQLARAFRNQALCYDSDSPDRTNSLTQALERLEPIAEFPAADDTVWRARLDRIICLRLLERHPAAVEQLAALAKQKPPARLALSALAEKIRLLLAAGQGEAALTVIEQGRTVAGQASADLDFAHLEAIVAAIATADQKKDPAALAKLQRRAAEQVQLLESVHGPFWMRRGETLLASVVAGEPHLGPVGVGPVGTATSADVTALERAAQSFYRAEKFVDAIATYDRAAKLAAEQKHAEEAFRLAMTAAAIAHASQQYADATSRYRQLALDQKANPQAGRAHLLAITSAAQIARIAEKSQQAARMQEYEALLTEHLQNWPQGDSADQARAWLGKLLESRSNWEEATIQYRQIPAGSPLFEAAVRGAVRSYETRLADLQAAGTPDPRLAGEAATWLEAIIVGPEKEWPAKWSPLAREAALAAARIRLHHTPRGYELAERVLSAALEPADAKASTSWLAEARLLMVHALAGQGKSEEARQEMAKISTGTTDSLLAAQGALARLSATARPEVRGELADLELRVAAILAERKGELKGDWLRRFETLHADAMVRAGRPQEALAAYQALLDKYPRDGDLHEAYAALLGSAEEKPAQTAALAKWREVEQKSRPGTDRWFRARYAQAELQVRLGQKEQAAKLIQLTAALHPALGGPELKAKFAALEKRAAAKQ